MLLMSKHADAVNILLIKKNNFSFLLVYLLINKKISNFKVFFNHRKLSML